MLRPTFSTYLFLLLAFASPVDAARVRLTLNAIDTSRCVGHREIRAFVSERELDGTLTHRPPSDYHLSTTKQAGIPPIRATTLEKSSVPISIALVMESSAAYADHQHHFYRALGDFLRAIPGRTRISLFRYDNRVKVIAADVTQQRAIAALRDLARPGDAVDLALIASLSSALRTLANAPNAPGFPTTKRQFLIAISDGIDRHPNWEGFKALGRRALAQGVAIYPLAFSPSDLRGPLLNLGELAKRSRGTLRWVRNITDLVQSLRVLANEIKTETVLVYRISRCARQESYSVAAGGLHSNTFEAVVRKLTARETAARSGKTKRIVLIVAAASFILAMLVILTFALVRKLRA